MVALIFFALSFLAPKALTLPNAVWHKFGLLLGAIVAPVAMGIVYLFTIIPIGLFLRAMGKDLLRQRLDKNVDSYWIQREEPVGSMKNQF